LPSPLGSFLRSRVLALLPIVLIGIATPVAPGGPPRIARLLDPADVQWTDRPGGESPREGERVFLRGIVTAVSPDRLFYYVGTEGGGPWSGLKIEGSCLDRVRGEIVTVSGVVRETWGETRLQQMSARRVGPGKIPAPAAVGVIDLVADGERWEGVLVRLTDVLVEGETLSYGEFLVSDGTGTGGLIDDEFITSYISDPGDTFTSITGVVSWGYGDFRVEPRSDDDLEGWVSVRDFDAEIRFTVRDETGRELPCKVTFFPVGGPPLALGPDDRASGSEDVAYLSPERRTVPLPSGTYDLVISRGIEYGLHEERVTVPPGGSVDVHAVLPREVDSSGWISGDFHVHCAPSTDSPVPVPGRLESLAGEGVEWAIATDHNRVTDYRPVIEVLGLEDWMLSSIGDEITTRNPEFGHFNAWPLEIGRTPPPYEGQTPVSLFSGARADPGNEVVQVNHPSIPAWGDQYFDVYAVSRYTGEPAAPGFSFEFDALEIFNGRYLDQGLTTLETWMRMLNNGRRITATGNSDSHHLVYGEPGYPRNFVGSPTDAPGAASEGELVQAVFDGRVFVSYGPFLDFAVNGAGLGETVGTVDGEAELTLRVQCPSWFAVDRGTIWANGFELAGFALDAIEGEPQDVLVTRIDRPGVDTWYLALVEGSVDLAPVPLALTNPIWVDADGNGVFDPPGNHPDATTVSAIEGVDEQGVVVRIADWVSAEGCATTDAPFPDPAAGGFYVDDGTGGVRIRETPGTVTEVRRGDRVRATGFVDQLLGETLVTGATVEILGTADDCPLPIPLATGDLGSGVEPLEGRLVRITGANVTGGSWPRNGAEGTVTLDDGSGPATLYVPRGVEVPPEADDLVDFSLTALVFQYDFSPPYHSGYLLMLRAGGDLFPPGALPGPEAVPIGSGIVFGVARPNPFGLAVKIPYVAGPEAALPTADVLNVAGRVVRRVRGSSPGRGEIRWDGRDSRGRETAAGLYFLRLDSGSGGRVFRIVKLR
jgi:hypothetical protein